MTERNENSGTGEPDRHPDRREADRSPDGSGRAGASGRPGGPDRPGHSDQPATTATTATTYSPAVVPDATLMRIIRWTSALLLSAAVAVLVVLALYWLRLAVIPVVVALLITALVSPLDRLMRRTGLPRGVSAGLAATGLVIAVTAVVWVVVMLLAESASGLAASLRDVVDRTTDQGGPLSDAMETAASSLSSLGGAVAGQAAGGVLNGLSLAGQLLAGSVLTLALVFFLLRDRERALSALHHAAPTGHGDLALRMARRAWRAMAGFMRGTTIIAATDAVLIALGLWILGVPQPAGLGALVFVGAYIPYAGAFLSGTVAVLVAFADQGVGLALAALAVILAVQFIEGTFLQPVVQSRTVSLHPALVLVAVTAGAAVGGLVGTLLAVPVTAAAFGILAELRASFAVPGYPPLPADEHRHRVGHGGSGD